MVGAFVLTDKPVLDLRWRLRKGRLLSNKCNFKRKGPPRRNHLEQLRDVAVKSLENASFSG